MEVKGDLGVAVKEAALLCLSLPLVALPLYLKMFSYALKHYLQLHMTGVLGCVCDELGSLVDQVTFAGGPPGLVLLHALGV